MEVTAKQLQQVKLRLRKMEKELSETIRRRESASKNETSPEIDPVAQTLIQVQDALRRILFDAFGSCIACGRKIDWLRLQEIPWTPYCAEDQSKYAPTGNSRGRAAAAGKSST